LLSVERGTYLLTVVMLTLFDPWWHLAPLWRHSWSVQRDWSTRTSWLLAGPNL